MRAREEILARIAARKPSVAETVIRGRRRTSGIETFTLQAEKVEARVRHIASLDDLPAAVADYLRELNRPASIGIAPGSALAILDWPPTMTISNAPPGIDDAAVSLAPFGIAETGTLVHLAGNGTPASWHFRPGLEIVAVKAADILSTLEDVVDAVRAKGLSPHTINLTTGPSRTADIEQTLEVGAHGPKAMLVLIVDGA